MRGPALVQMPSLGGATGLSLALLFASVHWCDGNAGLPVIPDHRYHEASESLISCLQHVMPFTHLRKIQMRGRMRRMETCEKHAQPFIVLGHDTAFLNGENEPKTYVNAGPWDSNDGSTRSGGRQTGKNENNSSEICLYFRSSFDVAL